MRWKEKNIENPKLGDFRIIKKFLWKPRCISGEYRWFEFVAIEQIYSFRMHCSKYGSLYRIYEWEDFKFVD